MANDKTSEITTTLMVIGNSMTDPSMEISQGTITTRTEEISEETVQKTEK